MCVWTQNSWGPTELRKLVEEQLPAQDLAMESLTPVVRKSRKPSGKEIHSDLHRRIYVAINFISFIRTSLFVPLHNSLSEYHYKVEH